MRIKTFCLLVTVYCLLSTVCFAQDKLLLDDFEAGISGGPTGTVDFGSGGGSSVEVTAAKDIKYNGNQSLKVVFDAIPGGYMWIARGYGLDAKNSVWLLRPETIDWGKYKGISFYMYGSNSGTVVAVDIKDAGGELWRYLVTDHFKGWQKVECLFSDFSVRSDWQPDSADNNGQLDFPVKSYQFEVLPEAKGAVYFDDVELIGK
ncbi:MAG: carbohydrate binding domain-containing protein [Candidatus Omnitrophota bacterium]